MDEQRERLARLARLVPHLPDPAAAVPARSWSNDAWLFEDVVLRVCWRGDLRRLQREAVILTHLPAAVPHPEVIDAGIADDVSWMLTVRLEGTVLRDLWPGFAPVERQPAIEQLGEVLAALHDWTPPPAVRIALAEDDASAVDDVVGRYIVPLRVSRLSRLVRQAAERGDLDRRLSDSLVVRLEAWRDADPFTAPAEVPSLVHGDANLSNVLWNEGRIAALLDFEWARLGPRDLELETFLRYSEPDAADVFRWLRAAYPGLFVHPDLVRRLSLYEIAFLFRQVLAWKPLPGSSLYRRIDAAMSGSARIAALVAAS